MTKNLDFDLDDPLGDLLSGDDSDDFFDDSFKTKTKSEGPKPIVDSPIGIGIPDKARTISDLFGITDSNNKDDLFAKKVDLNVASNKNQSDVHIDAVSSPRRPEPKPVLETPKAVIPVPVQVKRPVEKSVYFDTDDILSDILPSAKKSDMHSDSLLDDLLGRSSQNVIKTTEKVIDNRPSTGNIGMTETQPSSAMSFGGYAPSSSAPRESRRPMIRQSSQRIQDPLGLFSAKPIVPTPEVIKEIEIKATGDADVNTKKISAKAEPNWLGLQQDSAPKSEVKVKATTEPDLPEWLGGSGSKKCATVDKVVKTDKPVPAQQKSVEENVEYKNTPLPVEPQHKFVTSNVKAHADINPSLVDADNNATDVWTPQTAGVSLASFQINQQNAAISLQQQHSQLLMGMHLRGQEEKMFLLQKRQQEVLDRQEKQFADLIAQQMMRQSALESNIKQQQEKINNHLQILLGQPVTMPLLQQTFTNPEPSVTDAPRDDKDTDEDSSKKYQNVDAAVEVEIYKLRQEKQYVEETMFSLKENHKQEMLLLEESYRRQISMLENSLSQVESRLRNENTNLTEFYNSKISILEIDIKNVIEKYEQKIKHLNEEHKKDIERIYENNKQDIENLRLEHQAMIDNIRQTKVLEAVVVRESSSHSIAIKGAAEMLQKSCDDITNLNKTWDEMSFQREDHLKAKERELDMMQQSLVKAREQSEKDRDRLLDLVQSLETKLLENNQSINEERWTLRHQQASLNAKELALEKEKTFMRDQNEKEAARIEALKQDVLAQHERKTLQLEEERRSLNAEKTRLETLAKLQNINDTQLQANKMEIEAAVNAAKDAARLTDIERTKLYERQRVVEAKINELHEQQSALSIKSSELDALYNSTMTKQRISERAVQSARAAEQTFVSKIQILQTQLASVAQKEQELAQEKQSQSKERLALIIHKKNLEAKQCSLCKIGEPLDIKRDLSNMSNVISNPIERFKVGPFNNDGLRIGPNTSRFNKAHHLQSTSSGLRSEGLSNMLLETRLNRDDETFSTAFLNHLYFDRTGILHSSDDLGLGADFDSNFRADLNLEELYFNSEFQDHSRPERLHMNTESEVQKDISHENTNP